MNNTEDFRTSLNTSEDYRSIQKTTEEFNNASLRNIRIGRGKKYPGTNIPESEFDRDDYILMEEAYMLFEGKSERRSVRMIAEYCKTGELICVYDSDDKRWHISKESVENKIEKIKALNARKVQSEIQSTSQQASEYFSVPNNDSKSGSHKERETEQVNDFEQRIRELEKENMDLKITNRGKDYFIEQLQEERKQFSNERERFVNDLVGYSKKIGVLETQLKQIEAPKSQRPYENSEPSGHNYRDADIDRQQTQERNIHQSPSPAEPEARQLNYQTRVEEPLENQNHHTHNYDQVSIHPNSAGEPNRISSEDEHPRQ